MSDDAFVVCGIGGCDFAVERGEGRTMALHQSEDHAPADPHPDLPEQRETPTGRWYGERDLRPDQVVPFLRSVTASGETLHEDDFARIAAALRSTGVERDGLREALGRIKTLAIHGDTLTHIAEVAQEALAESTPSVTDDGGPREALGAVVREMYVDGTLEPTPITLLDEVVDRLLAALRSETAEPGG